MSAIKHVLQEEHDRLKALCQKYKDQISVLPRGSISVKNRKGKKYLYLANRESGKIKFQYIARYDSVKSKAVLAGIKERKRIQRLSKRAKDDLAEISKVTRGRKI